jgi:hypothetical protein
MEGRLTPDQYDKQIRAALDDPRAAKMSQEAYRDVLFGVHDYVAVMLDALEEDMGKEAFSA